VEDLEDGVPADATRALHGVSDKLSTALSVEYRVNELIVEATDRKNLCMLFPGWQPWL
jgi:phosphatidylinositol kinase/protein kinase (PI-3  family)